MNKLNINYYYLSTCYGILFCLLCQSLYYLFYRIAEIIVLWFELNLYIIPISLFIAILFFSIWYFKIQHFPKLKIWYFIIVLFFYIIEPYFIKATILIKVTKPNIDYPIYIPYVYFCKVLFFILFLLISWYKYKKVLSLQHGN